ncbi:MAG: 4'-phosphopantetheinyl transferase superfamily protein [Desulfuromonadales bacterium]
MLAPVSPWRAAPQRLSLGTDEAHLWRVSLADAEKSYLRHKNLLSPDELARAERLRLPEKAHAFAAGRTRLRQILGRYLDLAPTELSFVYGPHGKPALNPEHYCTLHFNLAHSGDLLLLAVAGRPLGVDLERIDPALDFAPLAERFFTPAEQAALRQAPPHRRRRAFYRLWTRKEAYLKGRGGGFSANLAEPENSAWRLRHFFVAPSHLGALAISGGAVNALLRWTWEEDGGTSLIEGGLWASSRKRG